MEGLDLVEYGLKSEEDVVGILNECFQRQQYYVETGDVLVTVNPWTSLQHAEKEVLDCLRLYKTKDKHHPLPPHPCSVAEKAVRNGSDSVIIPLGESGSGKSSNIQIILQYLALRCNAQEKLSKDEILAVNEVLDLFCNTKTLICNNSTRCLKVYEVFFDSKEQNLLGVNVKINVFEKMRVISQIKGESNFHIFHCLLNGLSSEQLQEHFLDEEHRYVPSLPKEAFCSRSQSLKCLERIGFNEEEIEDVLHLVSAIILLGNLQFGESSKRDVLAFRNGEVLEKAAILVGVPCATLAGLVITKSKRVRGQKVNISTSRSKAMYECDCLAVMFYETLVMWIEERINSRYTGHSRLQSDYSLVLLDIFGWENYSTCCFGQLCINTVNEVLQSMYNAIVFKKYQMELENEDIYLNESCQKFDQPGAVPFLLKPKGFFDVLHSNIEIISNDQNLLKKFDNSFKKEPRYISNSNQEFSGFLIEHFIGEVSYDITGFMVQSKNWLNNNILICLKGSKNKVVSSMAQERITRENTSLEKTFSTPSSSKKSSIVEKDWLKTNIFLTNSGKEKKKYASIKNSNTAVLTMSLTSLFNRISSSKVYFIRCINSNLRMQPEVFDHERVLRQVQWSNLYGTIKTRLSCLNSWFSLSEFIARYKLLFFHLSLPVSPTSELCYSVLSKRFDESQYRVGKTKVYLSRSLVFELDELMKTALLQVVLIQKIFRGVLGRKQYQAMIKIKNKYDDQRSSFFSQVTVGISKFHDHLALQISEDQRRLKQNKLKEEQAKTEVNEITVAENKQPVTSPSSPGRRMSYAWGDEVIIEETSDSLSWCKIVCFQRTKQLALFNVKDAKVVIDGTNHSFTADRIGFNSFPTPNNDKQMKKVKACIGRGVELYLAKDGSLIAIRLCKNPIFVKGHFCEDKLLKTLGELAKNEESMLFNYGGFMEKINHECHPARVAIDSEDRCLAMCVVHLCFVKNSENDDGAPCWVEVVLTQAVQYVKHAISLSMQRRREVQEKYHFKQPPALRMDSKMESTTAKILQLIRPSRYIETVKFKRKGWARKRVVSNPFLYGEISFNEDDRSESVCSSESSFESRDEINSPENREFYENVNVKNSQDKRQKYRSQSACLPESTSGNSSTVSRDIYENVETVQEKWLNFFEASQVVASGDLSDGLKEEDGSGKVKLRSSSENGAQYLYENVQESIVNTEDQPVVYQPEVDPAEVDQRRVSELRNKENERRVQCNDIYENVREQQNVLPHEDTQNIDVSDCLQEENRPEVDSQSVFGSHQSLANLSQTSSAISPMTDVDIPAQLHNREEHHIYVTKERSGNLIAEDLYVDMRKIKVRQSSEDCNLRGESLSTQSPNSEMSLLSGNDIQHDLPSPDYLDSVYTNFNMQSGELSQQNEDVYEVMNRSSHYEMEEQYVNYSSSRQYLQQRKSEVGITSSIDEESSLVKHQMSFARF